MWAIPTDSNHVVQLQTYPKGSRNPSMKFSLYSALFIGLMLPLSVFADTDTVQEDKSEGTRQPVSPTTGDVEGTVYLHDTDTPLTAVEVRCIEIDVSTRTDASGNFQFTHITPGTYTLSILHPTSETPTTAKIEVTAVIPRG